MYLLVCRGVSPPCYEAAPRAALAAPLGALTLSRTASARFAARSVKHALQHARWIARDKCEAELRHMSRQRAPWMRLVSGVFMQSLGSTEPAEAGEADKYAPNRRWGSSSTRRACVGAALTTVSASVS